jgi:lauroyl/myristoyl acyltransferase
MRLPTRLPRARAALDRTRRRFAAFRLGRARAVAPHGVVDAAIQYWLLRLIELGRYVPLRLAYWAALPVAGLLWLVLPEQRAAAIANMQRVTGDRDDAVRTARRSFSNYGRYLIDFVRASKIAPDAVASKVQFDRWHLLDEAYAEGKGVLIVLMHMGNWELGGPLLAGRGYKVNVIAQTFGDDRLNEAVVRARTVRGMNVIPADKPTFGIIRAMRRGEILGIHIDTPMRPEDPTSVDSVFFGRPVWVPAGPAWIALRTGARVIPAALVRMHPARDETLALIDFDVVVTRSGDPDRDLHDLTRRILAAHERFVRAYPDQWFMFRRMWPRSPRHEAIPRPLEPCPAET